MNIFINPELKDQTNVFNKLGLNYTEYKKDADITFIRKKDVLQKKDYNFLENEIYCMSKFDYYDRINIRDGECVDNRVDKELFEKVEESSSFFISTNDICCKPRIIPGFYTVTPPELISKQQNYWMNERFEQNKKATGQVFWRGRADNHSSRKTFYNFYMRNEDTRFLVEHFTESIYEVPASASIYDNYMIELSNSDVGYVLRGDRPWAYSFHDVIRAGAIPVMVSSMNDYGWENILNNVDDFMLRFDLTKHSMSYIHEQVCTLIEDTDRVLFMKENVRKLYKTFFDYETVDISLLLCLAKCIEIHQNDYRVENLDYTFISKNLIDYMNLPRKI